MAIELDYPLTRPFPTKWFGPASLAGAFVGIVFLVVVNVALVGYDTISVFKDDYNVRDPHWFDDFMPSRAKRNRCDATLLRRGDTFKTSASIFDWRLESVKNANTSTGLAYKGESMAGCDMASLFLNAVLSTWTLDVTAVVRCIMADNVEAEIKTSFAIAALPGRYDSYTGELNTRINGTANARLVALQAVGEATSDLGQAALRAYLQNPAAPLILSSKHNLPFCPFNSPADSPCLQGTPQFSTVAATLVFGNNTLNQATEANPELATAIMADYKPAVMNLAQALYAAVRIDLGNNHSNNFLLNPSVIDSTLSDSLSSLGVTTTPLLLQFVRDPTIVGPEYANTFPISSNFGVSHIQTTYLCRLERLKQPGSLFMSVLVATMSTFSAAWTVYLTMASIFVKRRDPETNCCRAHEYGPVRPGSPGFPMPRAPASSDKLEY